MSDYEPIRTFHLAMRRAWFKVLESINEKQRPEMKEPDIDIENERRREYNEKHFDDEVKG